MNFQPELAQAVMAGRKSVTRRLVSDNPRSPWWREECSLVVGRDYAVCPGRGKDQIGRVRIVSVDRRSLAPFNTGEAQAEGFHSVDAFVQAWKAINGSVDWSARVWRVEFQVAQILECKGCGHPGDDCICWYIAEQREEAAA